MQNEQSQGVSHAVGDSKVPEKVQQKVPQSLEEDLPNKVKPPLPLRSSSSSTKIKITIDTQVHDTGKGTGRQTHALDGGAASKVPLPIQKAVPEKLERALPDSIHNTGDHAKK